MPTIQANDATLHYTDSGGEGRPIVMVHGWPLSGEAFAQNAETLVSRGYRVITYDRRGFGESSKAGPFDYDTLVTDLDALLRELDLTDVVLLGFSMGGGEVARYCGRHGTDRLAGVVLSGSICPALCITDDNPDGAMPYSGFEDMSQQCAEDHPGFLDQFVTWFFSNSDGLTVDEETRQAALRIAMQSDPEAAAETILVWATDLRDDCAAIDVPTLLIHGDGDQNVPLAASSARAADMIPDSRLHVIAGGPHGANVSHRDEWEATLLQFLEGLDRPRS